MALIKCEDCKKEYSDKAAACPHCGAPNPKIAEAEAKAAEAETSIITAEILKQTVSSRLAITAISTVLAFLVAFVLNRDAGIIDNIPVFVFFIPIFGFVFIAIKNFGVILGVILGLVGLTALGMAIVNLPTILSTILGIAVFGGYFVYYLIIPIMNYRKAAELEKHANNL